MTEERKEKEIDSALDGPRLIERGFCLKQASIDSVHEKNVRHGHISTLHIWPARRPLAACRAALIATLLPDPGDPMKRKELLERIGGKVVKAPKKVKKGDREEVKYVEETEGGILHWGRESSPDIDFFREEIRKAYGGRAPKVLDPFAGGGAIPLEAMRLGCEATATDINPVAWFIEKCTLDYPQRFAGRKRPLPAFILQDDEFMQEYNKKNGIEFNVNSKKQTSLRRYASEKEDGNVESESVVEADLAFHFRAWGRWVHQRTKEQLEIYYPTVDGSPTVAYLWARTVTCKNCKATIPLIKTRWLCKDNEKRILLTILPNEERTGASIGIQDGVSLQGTRPAQTRAGDSLLGQGTMGKSGAWCPCCGRPGTISMTREDIRLDLKRQNETDSGHYQMTVVVCETNKGKSYRIPKDEELEVLTKVPAQLEKIQKEIPFGIPSESIEIDGKGSTWCISYGADKWYKLFTQRQLLSLFVLVRNTRQAFIEMDGYGYGDEWKEAIISYLASAIDRVADYNSTLCYWRSSEFISHTFQRFALPIAWDFCEVPVISSQTGGYLGAVDWIARYVDHALRDLAQAARPNVILRSAIEKQDGKFDLVLTDPPYYNAIAYSNLMDFFYVWEKRTLFGFFSHHNSIYNPIASPKWSHEKNDGELVDDPCRFGGDRDKSKANYEDGMFRAFQSCHDSLASDGRIVIVFAHKQPDAWESLVSAIIRSGFCVLCSWPIQTEMGNRTRALSSSALASSIWLVCGKRRSDARPGWDNQVLEEMRSNIASRLRDYWDAGVRGPDFVWAATGPALEAYSRHPLVKKADDPGKLMTVTEFLKEVRRIVMDFVVGRVLKLEGGERDKDLDNLTTYYLLHRNDFGFDDSPAGACILYAVSCNLSDRDLTGEHDILLKSGGKEQKDEDESEPIVGEEEEGTGSTFRLRQWNNRLSKNLGIDVHGKPAPLIDRIHKLMHLWKEGDTAKVNEYLDTYGLWKNQTFHQVLQALIELSKEGGEERSLLESISNHISAGGGAVKGPKTILDYER